LEAAKWYDLERNDRYSGRQSSQRSQRLYRPHSGIIRGFDAQSQWQVD
jgi:hypothetical protein